jgi:hypothetical protein
VALVVFTAPGRLGHRVRTDEPATSASVSFVAPTELVSIDAFNGGSTSSTITLACDQLPTVTASLPAGQSATVRTGWTVRCSTLTITSANGWWTNFDNLVIE